MEEIKEVVWNFEVEKSLGPNDFNMGFYKKCWEVIKDDLLDYVMKFYLNAILPKVVNASSISLIPKSSNP